MQLAIIMARVVAVIYVVSGIGIVLNKVDFERISDEIFNSPTLSFFSGILSIILGIVLIQYHNIWIWNWSIIITISNWMLLFGGIVFILYPSILVKISKMYKQKPVMGIFMIIFGIIIGLLGLSIKI